MSPWSLQAQVLSVPWDAKGGLHWHPYTTSLAISPPLPLPEREEAGTPGQGGPVWPLCPWQARPRPRAGPCGGLLSCMAAVGAGDNHQCSGVEDSRSGSRPRVRDKNDSSGTPWCRPVVPGTGGLLPSPEWLFLLTPPCFLSQVQN